jgi:hypothetical protein
VHAAIIDFDTSALIGETFSSAITIGDFVFSGSNIRIESETSNTLY